ncbi:UbiX family flavin prenyltransferase [Breoghania sp. L-A4]|uniref:UbiX family flavin prenyltransferase n=1 Tax=Breoghania sp. L-A4 TaxID=2304600 RepID=UPI000E35932C|nr:UbiX family flavin prenyltransferase [Breoghania sp. L-A4]AXS40740.1 UbiX family flavin prenyltransferase [Breoghania sp. L-A4]
MSARVIVGISGASGACLGRAVLEALGRIGAETHLVVSAGAERTIAHELGACARAEIGRAASFVHDIDDLAAPIASGSFPMDAMIVAPCSMRSLASIAHGVGEGLLARAADVTLKERRRLVLLAREAPLHEGHLEAMLKVTRMGAIVSPPVPPFYAPIESLEDMVRQIAARAVATAGLDPGESLRRWRV